MAVIDATDTDPHRAVKGWIQDYWMLRLLDQRGLDLWGGGGPFDLDVGYRKGEARHTAFKNFAQRFALLGWVIAWQQNDDDDRVLVAIPGHTWDPSTEAEVAEIGGCGGVALGLPPNLSHALYSASRLGPDNADDQEQASPRWRVPEYRSYTQLDTKVLQILENTLAQLHSADTDLDDLREAALAAAA